MSNPLLHCCVDLILTLLNVTVTGDYKGNDWVDQYFSGSSWFMRLDKSFYLIELISGPLASES